ncbi:MAG: hypothetical protein ACI9JN_002835 [Bacteroidia bacterium]|jgi:hypothetical protein
MNIYQYLLAIKNAKAINARRFDDLLKEQHLSLNQLGDTRLVSVNKYLIMNVNHEVLDHWIAKFAPPTSRVDATKRSGNSHLHRTSTAYFVGKLHTTPQQDFVVKCEDSMDISKAIPNASQLEVILIENSDCYTFSDSFLVNMGLGDLSHETIVIWSSGKSITHPNAINYLAHFKTVHYCPDYDLAGIEIYETLHRRLGENIKFVMPNNLCDYSDSCKKPKDPLHFLKALDKAKKLGFHPMVNLLSKGMGVLEQEALIGDLNE